MNNKVTYFIFLALFLSFLSFSGTALASATDGTVSGYAWGNNIGWVNFGCANCNAHITDAGMTGYAWSQNFGWIKLDAAQSGVDNNSEGALSGAAWADKLISIRHPGRIPFLLTEAASTQTAIQYFYLSMVALNRPRWSFPIRRIFPARSKKVT